MKFGNMLFIDLETTGTDPYKHMITEIAAEYHVNGVKVDQFFVKVRAIPEQSSFIDLEALKITNKSLKTVMTEGTSEAESIMQFLDWVLDLQAKDATLCGHNVHFDLSFLRATFTKYHIENWDRVVSYRLEDTCSLARTLQKVGLIKCEKVSLGSLVHLFEIPLNGKELHGAAVDVEATAKVYYSLVKLLSK